MKKWEAEFSQKIHNKKLKNAKPVIRTSIKYPEIRRSSTTTQPTIFMRNLSEFSLTKFYRVMAT